MMSEFKKRRGHGIFRMMLNGSMSNVYIFHYNSKNTFLFKSQIDKISVEDMAKGLCVYTIYNTQNWIL